ncbi:HET-domain-containing protein [Podospora aff. communis PSN243]|uniref:HET-domain-containing protein n=1 Tax=Podospora aff. communis PSN243 TaxID=3040156 RepID=A0AAV9G5Y2_9PEZI|nr:HET-domain-containing protein [Podospora aff. communis PSN243]
MPPLYIPLNNPDKEIRLLTSNYILTTHPLATAPPFAALSYVWGSPADTTPITINNNTISITKTLATALHNLRGTITIPLWADAICINQSSISERTHQVQIMHEIYSLASAVVVYLGSGTVHTDFAMQNMADARFRAGLRRSFFESTPSTEEVMVDVVLKHDLCKRPWWKRLWVRQEFILSSKDPVIACGDKFVRWSELMECFLSLPRSWDHPGLEGLWADCRREVTGSEDDVPGTNGIHLVSLDMIRENVRSSGGLNLFEAVRYVLRNSKATNSLDYVYGLLGILCEGERSRLLVHYEVERMELYRQVMGTLWTDHGDSVLRELLSVLEFSPENSDGRFPSWVPDFAAQPTRWWKDYWCLMGYSVLEGPKGAPRVRLEGQLLVLHGVILDRVAAAFATPESFDDIRELIPILRKVESAMCKGIQLPIPPDHPLRALSPLKMEEAVVQTLTRSVVEYDEPLLTGVDDEQVMTALLGRSELDSLEFEVPGSDIGPENRAFDRLARLLRAKFVGRQALVTESGFAGIGVRQIVEGDVVTFPFGGNAPLVLRPCGAEWAVVGGAYISGLMDPALVEGLVIAGQLQPVEFGIR